MSSKSYKKPKPRKGKGSGKPAPAVVLRATGSNALRALPVPGSVSNGRATGAPTLFSPELGELICARIAAGESLMQLCRDPRMPSRVTVGKWVRNDEKDPAKTEFSIAYARARESLLEHWAEEITEIADDGTNDWTDREVGHGRVIRTPDPEVVNRSKLRIETRRWLLSKLNASKFGDKIDVSLGGRGSPVIPIAAMTAEDATREYLKMLEKPKEV
jgi:hypothetical protein